MQATIVEPKWRRDVGRIVVPMRVENLGDLELVVRGNLTADQVRSLEVEALVDTGAKYVGLPASLIKQLGLHYSYSKHARTAAGLIEQRIYSAVQVYVHDRFAISDVSELPEDSPGLLGQIPLELMDFWIDTTNQKLVGNPEHGGQWMIDQF
jgi:predicted aspartyl protease